MRGEGGVSEGDVGGRLGSGFSITVFVGTWNMGEFCVGMGMGMGMGRGRDMFLAVTLGLTIFLPQQR